MVKFELKNGQVIFPTSGHGSRFSDGTVFEPSPEEIATIKNDWGFMQVKPTFSPIALDLNVGVNSRGNFLAEEVLHKMKDIQRENPTVLFLVPFMLISALKEMGIRNEFPHFLSTNATPETVRSAPQEKIWDVDNFSW
jgi:hypothetical protein